MPKVYRANDVKASCLMQFLPIFAIFLFALGYYIYDEQANFRNNGIITTATITQKWKDCRKVCFYYFSYEYVTGNQQQTVDREEIYSKSFYDHYDVEDTLDVYYLPNAPTKSLLVNNTQSLFELMSIGVIFTFLLLLLFTFAEIPKRWQYKPLADIQRGVVRKVNNYRKHHFQHPKIAESNENITQKYDLVVGNINR